MVGVDDWGNDANATAGSGYMIQDQQADVDTHERFYTEAKVANSGTHATNFTIGSASKWAVIGASFKPAVIASGSGTASGSATFTYDLNGNMASDGAKLYQYNEANQLKTVKLASNSATIAEYVYDYKGQRMVKKNYNNGTLANTVISWSDSFETKAIVGGGTETTNYYFANNELVAKKDNSGNKVYFHNDHLGSNSITTNQAGSQVENVTYDPWGKVLGAATQSKYLYTGQEYDGETGLNYYDARYYNADIRRFTQPDPIVQDVYDPQSLNRYSYARNNPLRYTDPTGHAIWDTIVNSVKQAVSAVQSFFSPPKAPPVYSSLPASSIPYRGPINTPSAGRSSGSSSSSSSNGGGSGGNGNLGGGSGGNSGQGSNYNGSSPVVKKIVDKTSFPLNLAVSAYYAYSIRNDVRKEAQNRPGGADDGTEGDAWRHARIMEILVKDTGPENALMIGVAHEVQGLTSKNWTAQDSFMDMHNNVVSVYGVSNGLTPNQLVEKNMLYYYKK